MLVIAISMTSMGKDTELTESAETGSFWGGKKALSVVFMADSVNTAHGTKEAVLKSLLLFRDLKGHPTLKLEEFSLLNSAPFELPLYFPHLYSVLKLIFCSLSGPSCAGTLTRGMYIFFHCCRKLLLCFSAFR